MFIAFIISLCYATSMRSNALRESIYKHLNPTDSRLRLSCLPWAKRKPMPKAIPKHHWMMNDEFRIMNFEVREYKKSLRQSKRPALSNLQYSLFIIRCSIFPIQQWECIQSNWLLRICLTPKGLYVYRTYHFVMLCDLDEVECFTLPYLSINIWILRIRSSD